MSSGELLQVGKSHDGGMEASESDNEQEEETSSENTSRLGQSISIGVQNESYKIEEKKMHGSSVIDIIQKSSVKLSGELSPIIEDKQKE